MKRLALAHTILLCLLLPFSVCARQTPADLILVNSRVFTADAANPSAEAADLVVLSQDMFSVDAPELPKTRSVLTVVGSHVVYDAKVLK